MCVCVCVYWAVAPQKKYTLGKGGYIRNFVGKVLLKDRGDGIAHKNGATTEDVGTAVAVVKVLCYKSEVRWFDSRWCH